MYRADAEHTGVYDDGGTRPDGVLKWTARTDAQGSLVIHQPSVVDGVVYFGSNEMKVYAVYASNGTRKWVSPTLNTTKLWGSPAVADGYVIVSGDGVYGLDSATGAVSWSQFPFPIDTGMIALRNAPQPPTVWNHMVFVSDGGNVGNTVAAISTSGEMVWYKFTQEWTGWEVGMNGLTNIAVHDGTLYFYAGGDYFQVDALTGGGVHLRNRFWAAPDFWYTGGPAWMNGHLYLQVSNNSHVGGGSQNPLDGKELWFNPFLGRNTGRITTSEVTVADGAVFIGCGNYTLGQVWALNAADGTTRWNFTVLNTPVSDRKFVLPAYANGVVYATGSNRLYALSAADGSKRWEWTNGTPLYSPPAIADGTVFVGGSDGKRGALYAIGNQAEPAPVQPIPGGSGAPQDLDHDGIYEDLNGNGRLDFADVVLFFNQMTWIAANEPIAAFDINGNGRIDFADVVWLFNGL
ncbi:MAG: PQQ-binding-like beta-propeller repeat protein [Methanospirillum sp.]